MTTQNRAEHLLQEARSLFAQRQYQRCRQVYSDLISQDSNCVDAIYGLGVLCMAEDRMVEAAQQFQLCLSLKPAHANATYYLGAIADKQGHPDLAEKYWRKAVQLDPAHKGAAKALHSLSSLLSNDPPVKESIPAGKGNDKKTAANKPPPDMIMASYLLMREDSSPIEQRVVSVMDSVAEFGDLNPSLRAFPLSVILIPLCIVLLVFVPIPVLLRMAVIVLGIGITIIALLRKMSLRVTFRPGIMQVVSGVLWKRKVFFDLVRVQDAVFVQGPINRLTNHGVLSINIEDGTVVLRGVGPAKKVGQLQIQLKNLAEVSRNSKWGKGGVYYRSLS